VTYTCEDRNGISGLWRAAQTLGEARSRVPAEPELHLPGCSQLALRYAEIPSDVSELVEWVTAWPNATRDLPALVEVSVTLASGGVVRRLCSIPAGTHE
jgi:hypothetical protein